MRSRILIAILFAFSVSCRSPKSQIEPGAALLHVKVAAAEATPDSLVVWAYDNSGILWNGERIPKQGTLTPVAANDLGTVLIQPGPLNGALRIHVVGMQGANRISDGILSIDSLGSGVRTFDLLLSSDAPVDSDGDGVPDSIDDCKNLRDPEQASHGNCSTSAQPDAGSDLSTPATDVPVSADVQPVGDANVEYSGAKDTLPGTDSVGPADDAFVPDDVLSKDSLFADSSDSVAPTPDAVAPDTADVPGAETVMRDIASEPGPDTVDAAADAADVAPGKDAAPDTAILCDAAGACTKPQGSQCSTDADCSSGHCADGVCCTNACAGPCRSCNQPSAVGVCQGYAIGTDPEGECTGGATCNGAGACGAPPLNLPNGQLCTGGVQCASHFCKDGVCCNTACTEQCQTCGTGTCTTVKRADDVPECTGALTCNGAGMCVGR